MEFLILLSYFAVSYLIGSIPFALVSSWIFKLPDPRTFGSKNPGATNVLRSGNKAAAFVTFFGDMVKGFLVVYFLPNITTIFENLVQKIDKNTVDITFPSYDTIGFFSILGVFLGHVFSVFLKFKGGKGVATAIGIYFGVHLGLGGLAVWLWLTILAIFRYSSLSGIIMSLVVPMVSILFQIDMMTNLALMSLTIILIYRHLGNIGNLLSGTETKVGSKNKK